MPIWLFEFLNFQIPKFFSFYNLKISIPLIVQFLSVYIFYFSNCQICIFSKNFWKQFTMFLHAKTNNFATTISGSWKPSGPILMQSIFSSKPNRHPLAPLYTYTHVFARVYDARAAQCFVHKTVNNSGNQVKIADICIQAKLVYRQYGTWKTNKKRSDCN